MPIRRAAWRLKLAEVEALDCAKMAPLTVCGKLLSPADRRVWQQALAMLMGLKRRNGFGDNELTAAVKAVLHHAVASRNCEDCGVTVTRVAASSGGERSGPRPGAIPKPAGGPIRIESPAARSKPLASIESAASHLRNEINEE